MSETNIKKCILVIEDEESISELICFNLKREGFATLCAASGEEGLKKAGQDVALVLLDIMLPAINGYEVCRLLKNTGATRHIPIIIISARGEEADIVRGLETGADDYITKPFRPGILISRVRAVLRRMSAALPDNNAQIVLGDLSINPLRFEVRVRNELVSLTFTEFSILHFLARHPGWVFTRYQIVDNIKGEDYAVTDRAVDVQIVGLRKKLGPSASMIETVRGVGYRFKE